MVLHLRSMVEVLALTWGAVAGLTVRHATRSPLEQADVL